MGQLILTKLKEEGHSVTGIDRKLLYGAVENLAVEIRNTDVIINLAGAPILQFWTKKRKKTIYDSRVITTRNLVHAINTLPEIEQPNKFISASAIGIYQSGKLHDETSTDFDNGFAGIVLQDWEEATELLPDSIQKNIVRIGLTIGKEALIIKLLKLPFQLGLGAKIGDGSQPFPFVHTNDVVKAMLWLVNKHEKTGIFNATAPENISNKEFSKTFAKVLKRPMFLSIPKFIFRLILGEASVMITESPQVEPKNLLENGFQFDYPTITAAMNEIV